MNDRTVGVDARMNFFLCSPEPEALLYVPGCMTLAVNRAHAQRFPETKAQVVECEAQVHAVLEASRESPPRTQVCHCEETFALEALRIADCTPESLYLRALKSGKREEGLQLRRESQNGFRKYSVDRVWGQLIDSRYERVMQFRFRQESRVWVTVTTLDRSNEMRRFQLLYGSAVLLENSATPAMESQQEPYFTVRTVIDKALSIAEVEGPGEAKGFLDRKLRQLDSVEYLQHRIILQKLCEAPDDRVANRLSELRERLLDTPVLTSFFGDEFTNRLRAVRKESQEQVKTITATSSTVNIADDEPAVDLSSKAELDRYLDYARESVAILSYESLRKASRFFGPDLGKLPEKTLVRRLYKEIKSLYAKDPPQLVEFDRILDTLEKTELQQQGWKLSESDESDSLRANQHIR